MNIVQHSADHIKIQLRKNGILIMSEGYGEWHEWTDQNNAA